MGVRGSLLSKHRGGRFFADGGRGATALHLCPCGLGAGEVPPADGALDQAHLGQREPMCSTFGMCPAHDAEQHIALPPQAVEHPYSVALARRSAQELMCLPLEWLTEVKHRRKRQGGRSAIAHPSTTSRYICTPGMTDHRVLLFASGLHCPRFRSDAGDGLPVRAGGLFGFGAWTYQAQPQSYISGGSLAMKLSMEIR